MRILRDLFPGCFAARREGEKTIRSPELGGLCALINRGPDLEICGEADDARCALSLIARLRPVVLVTDIALKSSSGIELIKNALALVPDQSFLTLSMYDESVYAERAIRAGARGYIMKKEATETILPAIRWSRHNLPARSSQRSGGLPAVPCKRPSLLSASSAKRLSETTTARGKGTPLLAHPF